MTSTRPWELAEQTLPWMTQQPIYDRVVSVRRPINPISFGSIAYGGLDPTQETVITSGLLASIEIHMHRGHPEANVPADAPQTSGWRIFIPFTAANAGQIVDRDIIADDLGRRFVVIAAYPSALGFQLYTELLEA